MADQKRFFNKYQELLGVEVSKPSFELLGRIVKAHLIRIPFENISKLLYKKQGMNYIPDLSIYLDGIEKYNFGGTCYTNNYYLYLLLEHLGFDVRLCGADMKNPDVHLVNIVRIDEHEYIVDGGYAAPFLTPLPRDLAKDYFFGNGVEKYVVKPQDENGRTRVEQHYDGKLQHWYTAKPLPRKIEEFSKVIEDSYADDATFMNAVRITRFYENGSLILKNLSLIEINSLKSSSLKIRRDELPLVIRNKFGMPEEIVKEAISGIKELKDIYD
jgi:N-hydroxyarylamine O-acetyltransferase